MNLEEPLQQADRTYDIRISGADPVEIRFVSQEVGSHATPPPSSPLLYAIVNQLAELYEPYSREWFQTPTAPLTFSRRVSYSWNFGQHLPYIGSQKGGILVKQVWIVELLRVLPLSFQIQWRLETQEFEEPYTARPPGPNGLQEIDSVPLAPTNEVVSLNLSLRARARRKVRHARLLAAMAKWRAAQLADRYYRKYGPLPEGDRESVLSTDSEDQERAESPVPDKNIR